MTNFIRFTVYLFKSKIAYLNFQRVGDKKLEKSGKIKGKKNQVFFLKILQGEKWPEQWRYLISLEIIHHLKNYSC